MSVALASLFTSEECFAAGEGRYNADTGGYEMIDSINIKPDNIWGDGEIVLLVNSGTASAAELFAYFMGNLDNVTIMGMTKTVGSAMATDGYELERFQLYFPIMLVLDEEVNVLIDSDASGISNMPLDVQIPLDEEAFSAIFEEDKDVKPLKKIRKKLLVRSVIIIILLIVLAATYIACEVICIPVTYVGEDLMNEMEVVFMEDGVYLRRENLSVRGDIIIVEDGKKDGHVKFYIGENVPDHFRLSWWERTCYTQLVEYPLFSGQEIKEVAYCDKDGNVLYVLWQKEEQTESIE